MQERLGQRGEQVLFVGEVAVEHRGGFTGRRGDVGQGGAVKTSLCEQLSGGLFDSLAGLQALGGKRLGRHASAAEESVAGSQQ
jgi:hypothetical protein